LAYVGLRLAAFLPASVAEWPDTGTYVHTADQPILSAEFWAGWRAPTVPFVYKVLPDVSAWRAAGQLVASIACWLALAGVVAWCVRGRGMRLAAFGVVLLFSLSVWLTQWDTVILSESLSVSVTAAVLAAWLAFARAPNAWTVAAVLATTLPWALVRDTNVVILLLALPIVLLWVLLAGRRLQPIVLVVGLAAILGLGLWSSGREYVRTELAMYDVIGVRVLTDPGELDWFRDRGMPVTPLLLAQAGRYIGADGNPVVKNDPRLEPFRQWFRHRMRRTLTTYLVAHPGYALEPVVRDPSVLLATEPSQPMRHGGPLISYRPSGAEPLLPEFVGDVVYPPSVEVLLIWLVVVVAAGGWLVWRGAGRPVWAVPAVVLLLQVAHAAVVWHGDPADMARHAFLVGLMTRLSLLLLTLFIADALLARRVRTA
jgi:hypothetical protein